MRKNAKIDVEGSGGFDVPVALVGCIFLNGFLLGCPGIVYAGNEVSCVLVVLFVVLSSVLVSAEFDAVPEPESDDEG
jgi:hypothetical protein